ncbi:MAG: hypothetical protein IJA58_06850 [Lachnospiraceae bacterium]|nr:hypothetical protein [Lachnospiraceae bacterium]
MISLGECEQLIFRIFMLLSLITGCGSRTPNVPAESSGEVTEAPTTEAPKQTDIHTEEVQIAGDGIVQIFDAGTTVLADLNGYGAVDSNYVEASSMMPEDL